VQAAAASAASFAAGGILPILAVAFASDPSMAPALAVTTIAALVVVGALSAWAGGAPILRAVARVVLWGLGAMGVTAIAGAFFGAPS
jgi:VIT1/CCC1 family predicted Fe2+/Mn2+ transporter